MRLRFSADVEEFAAAAQEFLDAAPASRNMLRGIVLVARRGALSWNAPPGFWWVEDGGEVAGCATWTPPFPLLVTTFPAAMADELLASAQERARAVDRPLRHVFGPRAEAESVAAAWTRSTGRPWAVQMAEYLHECDAPVAPPEPPGAMRQASVDDLDHWHAWSTAFEEESGVIVGDDMRRIVEQALREGRGFYWEDPQGVPVSMVGHAPPLPDMARIGPVYTPPDRRGHGYARRLTYEVTRTLLDRGLQRCALYTDAANPVSNSIYRQVGYRPIEEHAVLRFD
jgi:predicted GNAT family acetyltransferase